MSNSAFYEPGIFEPLDIASTQKVIAPITFAEDVPTTIGTPEIVFISNNRVIKTLTEGDGITVATNRLSLIFEIYGADFIQYNGVKAECSFFNLGVVEYIFTLKAIKAYITPAI